MKQDVPYSFRAAENESELNFGPAPSDFKIMSVIVDFG